MPRRIGIGLFLALAAAATSIVASAACGSFSPAADRPDATGPEAGASADASAASDGDAALRECFALSFDGVDDYVEVPDHADLDPTGASTIEAWVRYDKDEKSEMQVVSHHDHDAKTGYVLMIFGFGTILKEGGAAELGASGRYYDGTNIWQAGFGAATQVDKGAFTHIAVVYDGNGNVRTYVNGDPKVTRGPTTNPANADDVGPLRIGASSQGSGGFFFPGLIDEVRISKVARYGTARSKSQRRWTSDVDTVALYHFDEGNGDVARDETGRHDGQIFGAAWKKVPCEP